MAFARHGSVTSAFFPWLCVCPWLRAMSGISKSTVLKSTLKTPLLGPQFGSQNHKLAEASKRCSILKFLIE